MTDPEADLDTDALAAYVARELDGTVVDTEVLGDSLNLNLGVATAGEGLAYVLRRAGPMRDTEGFLPLAREYELLERLEPTPVPAPTAVLYCADESVLGDPFFLTEYVEGAAVPMGDPLEERFPDRRSRAAVGDGLVDALAAVHSLDPGGFADPLDRRGPREQVESARDRIHGAGATTGRDVSLHLTVADRLLAAVPPDPPTAPIHGDFKPGNLLFAGDPPGVAAVLDWEAAALGDPLTELGYLLLYWRDPGDPAPSVADLAERHGDRPGMAEVRDLADRGFYPFTSLPGAPTRRDLVARYEERTGLAFERDRFYRAHAALVLASVWEDLHRRAVAAGEGDRSDYPPLSDYVARYAAMVLDGEVPL